MIEYNYVEQGATPVASFPLLQVLIFIVPIAVMVYIMYCLFEMQFMKTEAEEVIESE